MVKVLLYGVARLKFNTKEIDIKATKVKELLKKIHSINSDTDKKTIKEIIIIIIQP